LTNFTSTFIRGDDRSSNYVIHISHICNDESSQYCERLSRYEITRRFAVLHLADEEAVVWHGMQSTR